MTKMVWSQGGHIKRRLLYFLKQLLPWCRYPRCLAYIVSLATHLKEYEDQYHENKDYVYLVHNVFDSITFKVHLI